MNIARDGGNRLFICERIWQGIDVSGNGDRPTEPFLDVRGKWLKVNPVGTMNVGCWE